MVIIPKAARNIGRYRGSEKSPEMYVCHSRYAGTTPLPEILCGSRAGPMWQSMWHPQRVRIRATLAAAPKIAGYASVLRTEPMWLHRQNRPTGRRPHLRVRNGCGPDVAKEHAVGETVWYRCGPGAFRVRESCGSRAAHVWRR